jgi:hypothetical protein
VIEEETWRDEAGMMMSYKVIEAPMPFEDYVSSISVAAKGAGCRVDWTGDFTPIGDEDKVVKLVRRIYQVSLQALAAHLAE